ncbi:nitrogenase molybdenum-iron protein subunit beta [Cereibacter changlensis JA139]|uniref:Nitrogenase molybdenum-iron protein beta chain n=2 Tax=Cereibacter changlensis TaxID=402884 RepID=A0A2T4JYZ4_9RHOB|nr:nitrogenase molybdenum-iron protein subunit beta [Cereibacter changlensis]PTE23139.1 nitrogenase molybdenum-iron protein subunit beta [Cereibacter changlensis JA139]PZX49252.1 Mo-nitrogenase MoFe protein subunit NifK [Cereibacter changlensis]
MPQSADKVLDHTDLFHQPEYKAMLDNKRATYEHGHPPEKVAETDDWTRSWDYREKNLARACITINPAKACQPLGAVFAAAGYEETMSFVHGSQGCVAYYRSHLARHFKEPASAVSSSMTEDSAVFGGLNNLVEGLANTHALYSPKMIAVSTTCMAEVIGDDLNSFIIKAREKESVPADYPVPFAHTPAFVGSHVDGYDNMQKGILSSFWKDASREAGESLNIIPGFDGYAVANIRELKRMLGLMGVEATVLSDVSEVYDTPSDGEYRMYAGGTTLDEVKAALNAKATVSLQEFCTRKTLAYCAEQGQETAAFHYPMGVQGTDEFLMKIAELTGKDIPESLRLERGRLVDAMADSQSHLHGKTYAIYGDPDFVYSMARFVMETGGEPRHCLATNGTKDWEEKMQALLASSPFGKGCQVWAGKDLWHLRSIMVTEPVDLLIGNSYGKYLERDTGTPLIRLTFPIFDRHHHHRFPTFGYQGALTVLVKLLDKIFDKLDADTGTAGETDISFDLTR